MCDLILAKSNLLRGRRSPNGSLAFGNIYSETLSSACKKLLPIFREVASDQSCLLQSRAGLSLLQSSGLGQLVLAKQAQAPLRFVEDALKQRGSVKVMPLAYCFCSAQ